MVVLAFCLAASRVNHGLVDSSLPAGPGLTLDESFNIAQGVYLFEQFCDHGPLLFTPSGAKEVFGADGYLPDHPPLGRFVLGAAHQLTSFAIPGAELSPLNVSAARLGSCIAFALTVLLLYEFTRRRYGTSTALIAAVVLMLMPRVIGHARVAALESATSLFWLTAILPLLAWWTSDKPPSSKHCFISGFSWGLLLLTKVQGILLPPLVIVWALIQFKDKAIRPLALWGMTGCAVFFFFWPWLWLDPIAHILQYLGRTADRPTLFVWYLGERYADKTVPWHFPFVMTFVTLPLLVLAGLGLRAVARKIDRIEMLAIASVVWPLIVFALPGTPVYDGTRLFLIIMPLVALLTGRGYALFWLRYGRGAKLYARYTAGVLSSVVLAMSFPSAVSGTSLCFYNSFVSGSNGALRAGFETDYWASGLNVEFWKSVPENSTVFVAPVCHQFQLTDVQHLVPVVKQRNITLLPFEYDPQKQRGLILLIHRLADLRPSLRTAPKGAPIVSTSSLHGVVLGQLIDTTDETWPILPDWPSPNAAGL